MANLASLVFLVFKAGLANITPLSSSFAVFMLRKSGTVRRFVGFCGCPHHEGPTKKPVVAGSGDEAWRACRQSTVLICCGTCEQHADDHVPGPAIAEQQQDMRSQPSFGISASAHLFQQGIAFVRLKSETGVHGLISGLGWFVNPNPGSSHIVCTSAASMSLTCGAI
jgi:hypothetical protein